MPLFRFETDSADRRARWQAALADIDQPGELAPLLVVTDHAEPLRSPDVLGYVILSNASQAGHAFDPTTLTLQLPAQAGSAELVLACRLMVEIVRLRRALSQADATRAELVEEALHDPLTGVSNRRAWDLELARQIAPDGTTASLAVAVFDLDHFKEVNDRAGHLEGDKILAVAAAQLRGALRQSDFLARIGGDEFGLILPFVSESSAREVIERVRGAVGQGPLDSGASVRLTASVGWNWSPSAASPGPMEQWVAADRALQRAKQSGGDRSERE